jgi:N-acetylglucosamine-6-phosphate deacetylase
MQQVLQGHILTPDGFVQGTLHVEQGRIAQVQGRAVTEDAVRASSKPLLLPGFIDTHVHGGGGRDLMDGGDAATVVAAAHAQHGSTALLATTMTAPLSDIEAALRALAPHCRQRSASGAHWLGVHLEGPYLSPHKMGAQPSFERAGTLEEIERLGALAPIRVVTLAPEVAEHLSLIAELSSRGYRVQLGHSNASYEVTAQALAHGACGFTHLFNAMSGLHHREPGMVGAALAHAQHAELIADLQHVHPGAIRAALRCIPGLFCVTDATAAAAMPDGEYRLGRQRVFRCMNSVRLADGSLAGSALTMDQALRNLVSLGVSLREASARVSTHAADYLGLPDRGRLRAGAVADVVMLNAALQVQNVMIEGEMLELAHA